jgi:predicted Fe-Mo cluster-binding NifX family protein
MKIGFPAAGVTEDKKFFLSQDFVESGAMGIFDTDSNEVEVVKKEAIKKSLIEWVKIKEIDSIITPQLHALALRVFKEHEVTVFKAEGNMLALNIELFKTHQLVPFSLIEMGAEGASCSPSMCSSCGSSCG